MATNWSVANATAILKMLYPKGVSEVLAPQCEAFRRLKKDKEALSGEGRYVSVQHTGGAGVSSDFSRALANKAPGRYVRFRIEPKPVYAVGSVDGLLINRATNNAALVDVVKATTSNLAYSIGRSIAADLYGDGSGALATIDASSTVNTATIKLSNPSEAIKFEPGMAVQAWDGTSSTLRSSGARATIVAVDPDAGTVTASAAWNTLIAAIAVGDKLILDGNFRNVPTGFAGWLPTVAPTSGDNFFGVDRSENPNRLAGVRVNGSGGAIDEILIEAANKVAQYGGAPDVAFVNYLDFNDIALARQSHIVTKDGTNTSQLGFESFKIVGPRGVIQILPDSDCPKGRVYLLTSSSWTIGSSNELPHIVEEDGLLLHRSELSDSYEMRMRGDWNLFCDAPGKNAVVTL